MTRMRAVNWTADGTGHSKPLPCLTGVNPLAVVRRILRRQQRREIMGLFFFSYFKWFCVSWLFLVKTFGLGLLSANLAGVRRIRFREEYIHSRLTRMRFLSVITVNHKYVGRIFLKKNFELIIPEVRRRAFSVTEARWGSWGCGCDRNRCRKPCTRHSAIQRRKPSNHLEESAPEFSCRSGATGRFCRFRPALELPLG